MRKLHELTWMLAATLVCGASVFTSCTSDNDDNPVPESGASGELVGQWYSDVSGATYAAWTYGKAWQQMEFNADGTGTTSISYALFYGVPHKSVRPHSDEQAQRTLEFENIEEFVNCYFITRNFHRLRV